MPDQWVSMSSLELMVPCVTLMEMSLPRHLWCLTIRSCLSVGEYEARTLRPLSSHNDRGRFDSGAPCVMVRDEAHVPNQATLLEYLDLPAQQMRPKGLIMTGKPYDMFESIYASAAGDSRRVPWANLQPNKTMLKWLRKHDVEGQHALVVGCGLGDDAEGLSAAGFDVTAFDVSPTAVAWCQERFPGSRVSYEVADLFAPPDQWVGHFDFVFEHRTIQSLPPDLQPQAVRQISQFPRAGGVALIVCNGRDPDEMIGGPPWPLPRTTVDEMLAQGYDALSFNQRLLQKRPTVYEFEAAFQRHE